MVVGDPADDTAASNAGAVFVYVNDGTGAMALQATLTASDAAASASFGREAQVSGDTIAVYALGAGATYIFDRTGTSWSETKILPGVGGGLSLDGDTLSATVGGTTSIFGRDQGGADNWGVVQSGISGTGGQLSGDTLVVGANVHYRDQGGANNWGFVTTHACPSNSSFSGDIVAGRSGGFSSRMINICERDEGGADNWGLAIYASVPSLISAVVAGDTVVGSVMPQEPAPETEQYFTYFRKVGGSWQEDQTAFTALVLAS